MTANTDTASKPHAGRATVVSTLRGLAHTRLGARAVGSLHGVITDDPVFALTFDDGPYPNVTPGILELLGRRNGTATFFMRADHAIAYPDLARRVAAEGHEVGVHGFRHDRLTELGPSGIRRETAVARRELHRVIGVKPHWFRPPFGAQNLRTFAATRMQGMDVAVWAVSVRDAFTTQGIEIDAAPGRGLAFRVGGVEVPFAPGGILLLHDAPAPQDPAVASANKIALVERILDRVADVDGRVVTLTELLRHGQADRRSWRSPGY